jgi:hypothetical protein
VSSSTETELRQSIHVSDVPSRNEPRYLFNIHANQVDAVLLELSVKLRQPVLYRATVRIDDSDQPRLDAGVPSAIGPDFDWESIPDPLFSASKRWNVQKRKLLTDNPL